MQPSNIWVGTNPGPICILFAGQVQKYLNKIARAKKTKQTKKRKTDTKHEARHQRKRTIGHKMKAGFNKIKIKTVYYNMHP